MFLLLAQFLRLLDQSSIGAIYVNFKTLLSGAVLFAAIGAADVDAASVTCGNASLGIRVTTVDPAKSPGGLCYAGLTNLGDPQLEALMNLLTGATDADIVERDNSNSNGGGLNIAGVGGTAGTWSFGSSAWGSNDRLFLYFHFGDAQDNPGPTSTTDPDIFIVELMSPDVAGKWSFSGKQGLSNIALIGIGDGKLPPQEVPEPASLALVGLGLLASVATLRRRRRC